MDQFGFITKDLVIDNTGDENLNYTISITSDDQPTSTFAERVAISLNTIKANGFEKVRTNATALVSNTNSSLLQLDTMAMENLVTNLYATSFEEFDLGELNGQFGWIGQFDGNWIISDENAFEGGQHLRGISDGLGATRGNDILGISPIFETPGDEPFTVFEAQVNIQGSGVTWEVIPATANPRTLATRLRFNPDGSVETLSRGCLLYTSPSPRD